MKVTKIPAPVKDISTFKRGLFALLVPLFDEFRGSVHVGGVHDCGVTNEGLDKGLKFCITGGFENVGEEGVLHYAELDALLEALATQLAGLSGIESGDIRDVEIGICLQLFRDILDNLILKFFLHNSQFLLGTVEECLEVNFNAGAHRGCESAALHVSTLEGLGFELGDRIQHLCSILIDLLGSEGDLAYASVHNAGLVDLEVDLTALDVLDGVTDFHGNGAGLGVRHEAAGAEDLTEGTDLRHNGRGADDDVDVGPTALDLLDVFVETCIVGSCCLCLVHLVGGAERENAHDLTGSVREGDNAADHLVGLTGVNAEIHGELDGRVELGESNILQKSARLCERINLGVVELGHHRLLIFRSLTHSACSIKGPWGIHR